MKLKDKRFLAKLLTTQLGYVIIKCIKYSAMTERVLPKINSKRAVDGENTAVV